RLPAFFFLPYILLASLTVNAADLEVDVQKKVLANGVTVLVWERESAGRVGARSFYRVDIAAERPGTVGLVHMLEHHLFKGDHIAGTKDWDADQVAALRALTLEDVNAAARKYLHPENLIITVSGQVDVVREHTPESVRERLGWSSP